MADNYYDNYDKGVIEFLTKFGDLGLYSNDTEVNDGPIIWCVIHVINEDVELHFLKNETLDCIDVEARFVFNSGYQSFFHLTRPYKLYNDKIETQADKTTYEDTAFVQWDIKHNVTHRVQ